jgi:hypothetical protein
MIDREAVLVIGPEKVEVGRAYGSVALRLLLPTTLEKDRGLDLLIQLEPDEADRLASTLSRWASLVRSELSQTLQ